LQNDGNLVVYNQSGPIFATNTDGGQQRTANAAREWGWNPSNTSVITQPDESISYQAVLVARDSGGFDPGHAWVAVIKHQGTRIEYTTISAWPNNNVPTVNHSSDYQQTQDLISGNKSSDWAVKIVDIPNSIAESFLSGGYRNTLCTQYSPVAITNSGMRESQGWCNCVTQATESWKILTGEEFRGLDAPYLLRNEILTHGGF
jgi:hypothetical protein